MNTNKQIMENETPILSERDKLILKKSADYSNDVVNSMLYTESLKNDFEEKLIESAHDGSKFLSILLEYKLLLEEDSKLDERITRCLERSERFEYFFGNCLLYFNNLMSFGKILNGLKDNLEVSVFKEGLSIFIYKILTSNEIFGLNKSYILKVEKTFSSWVFCESYYNTENWSEDKKNVFRRRFKLCLIKAL